MRFALFAFRRDSVIAGCAVKKRQSEIASLARGLYFFFLPATCRRNNRQGVTMARGGDPALSHQRYVSDYYIYGFCVTRIKKEKKEKKKEEEETFPSTETRRFDAIALRFLLKYPLRNGLSLAYAT